MKNCVVTSAQYPITYHQSLSDWKNHIRTHVEAAARQKPQIILFPEYGSMELVSLMSPALQKDVVGQVYEMNKWLSEFVELFEELAKIHQVVIVAPSFPVQENGKVVNRAYVFSKKGLVGYQDKFMMTRFEKEEWNISSSDKILTLFETDYSNFGIQICYDVEFSIGSHHLCQAGAEIILVPSCTETIRGATRVHVGARARALENQCYTVVSQTVGQATWCLSVDVNYGYSAFYSTPDFGLPEEGILNVGVPNEISWNCQSLDLTKIKEVREKGAVFNFKDANQLQIQFAGENIEIIRKTC